MGIFSETCHNTCSPQCSFTKFDFQTTFTGFPNPGFHKYLRFLNTGLNSTDWNYTRENFAEVEIQVTSLTVEHTIVYAKYEIFSASSAIGGLFGMFLGGSMLTVYELAELVLQLMFSFFNWILLKLERL